MSPLLASKLLLATINHLKGPAHSKNENLYFLALAQTKRMQPILVPCEALFRSNSLKKNTSLLVAFA